MRLLVVVPLTAADLPLAENLFKRLAELGPYEINDLLVVSDQKLTPEQVNPLLTIVKSTFARGEFIKTQMTLPNEGFPYGYNFRFETAARHIQNNRKMPWLWLDPRSVPMQKGWLREIEEAYFRAKKQFMGFPVNSANPTISPVAVYPATLPKFFYQRLISKRGTPFEISCADILSQNTHKTTLIWAQPMIGGEVRCLPQDVPHGTVLVHTQAAKMLTAALRGEPVPEQSKPVTSVTESVTTVLPPSRAAYYHSGQLGDVIYALAAIKIAGGGKLLLGPKQRKTSPAGNPIKEEAFQLIEPLLKEQPYLSSVTYSSRYPGTDNAFDLNRYRNNWDDTELRKRTGISSIAAIHAYTLGCLEKFRPDVTWLTVSNPIRSGMFTVHRSERYHDDTFPWELIVSRYAGRLLFVGLPSEHKDFQRKFNCRTAYWNCLNFLDMARVIAGSFGFIGNQSFPMALALGLGQRVVQEVWEQSPDCVLIRNNFLKSPINDATLEKWEKSTL